MRSHRIQKAVFKDTPNYTFTGDFSLFREFTVKYQEEETNKKFTELPVYTQPATDATNTTTDEYLIYGKKAVEDFSEEIKYQRRAHLKKLMLLVYYLDLPF